MRTHAIRWSTALTLLLPIAIDSAPARAMDHHSAPRYSCRFERTTGYSKSSPRKPTDRRDWTFALQPDHTARRVALVIDGVTTTAPAIFRDETVQFTIPLEGRKERVFFDTKDLDFVMVSDTRKARLMHLGQCERLGV
jgi:hypothetical protein